LIEDFDAICGFWSLRYDRYDKMEESVAEYTLIIYIPPPHDVESANGDIKI
jgi:hypothetical protein